MINRITKETWELWAENIEYIIDHTEKGKEGSEAYNILKYLESEGAFTVIDESEV